MSYSNGAVALAKRVRRQQGGARQPIGSAPGGATGNVSAHQRGAVRQRMLRRLAQHAEDRGIRIETAAGLEEWRGVLRRPVDAVALVTDHSTGQGLAWLSDADLQDLQPLLGKGVAA